MLRRILWPVTTSIVNQLTTGTTDLNGKVRRPCPASMGAGFRFRASSYASDEMGKIPTQNIKELSLSVSSFDSAYSVRNSLLIPAFIPELRLNCSGQSEK